MQEGDNLEEIKIAIFYSLFSKISTFDYNTPGPITNSLQSQLKSSSNPNTNLHHDSWTFSGLRSKVHAPPKLVNIFEKLQFSKLAGLFAFPAKTTSVVISRITCFPGNGKITEYR